MAFSDSRVVQVAEIARFLMKQGVRVHCEWSCKSELPELEPLRFDQQKSNLEIIRQLDFCVCVGGDGTVLHLNSLFQGVERPPPVIAFARGTLGFLTPFEIRHYPAVFERVLNGHVEPVYVVDRARFSCTVLRKGAEGKDERLFTFQPLNEASTCRIRVRGLMEFAAGARLSRSSLLAVHG